MKQMVKTDMKGFGSESYLVQFSGNGDEGGYQYCEVAGPEDEFVDFLIQGIRISACGMRREVG